MWLGPTYAGQTVELKFSFSLRGIEQARANLYADCPPAPTGVDVRRTTDSGFALRRAALWRTHSSRTCVTSAWLASTGSGRCVTWRTTCGAATAKPSSSAASPHPSSHTLDLAFGYLCTATVAHQLDDDTLAVQFEAMAAQWVNAFDSDTGLVKDSTFYEGGMWNYSFRLVHDMASRIELAGGDESFIALLDAFFGFGQPAITAQRPPGCR